jgi:uncharacterized protein YicC (UPF0701 family)
MRYDMHMAKRGPKQVSEAQKQAMAAGRADGRVVKRYLEALEQHRPKRGRKRTPESIQKRLATLDEAIPSADPLRRVTLVQQRMDLEEELNRLDDTVDISALETEFTGVVKGYSERKGISYAAWREVGVPAEVLKAAGVSRSS